MKIQSYYIIINQNDGNSPTSQGFVSIQQLPSGLGIDFGLRQDNFLVTSTGLSFSSYQRCLSTCAADKPYCQSSKCMSNGEYFHKLATFLVLSANHFVAVEQLGIDKMLELHPDKTSELLKWNRFLSILHSVAKKYGRKVYHVSPSQTSTICSRCGAVNKKPYQLDRQYRCRECGLTTSRDINAARNVLERGREKYAESIGRRH